LLWRSYARVSFAVKAPWVVGRFCQPTGAAAGKKIPTAVDNVENVNPICIDAAGYNKCYNKMALNYHNVQRALREGTKNLELDSGIAKYIQMEMDKAAFNGKIPNKGPYASCGESTYKQDKTATPGADDVEYTNEASKSWYAGASEYDQGAGKQVAGGASTGLPKMLAFTQMVWKNTSKVGFGVKGDTVIAWYCDVKGN
jgi:hypothetical protein